MDNSRFQHITSLSPSKFGFTKQNQEKEEAEPWTLKETQPPELFHQNENSKQKNSNLSERKQTTSRKRGYDPKAIKEEFKTDFTEDAVSTDKWWLSDESDEEEDFPGNSIVTEKDFKYHDTDPLYDPGEDDRNMKWMNKMRKITHTGFDSNSSKNHKSKNNHNNNNNNEPIESDAILSCPGCFTTVCIDCQRHRRYPDQYRAMFVQNCNVDTSKKLRPQQEYRIQKQDGTESEAEGYYSVYCAVCDTQLAMYDVLDQTYHFFHVAPSTA